MSDGNFHRFASLYRETVAPLRHYLAKILRNSTDAHDVAHDAYLRVYAAMSAQNILRPTPFLYVTARRLALNHLRDAKPKASETEEQCIIEMIPASTPGVERLVMAREEWAEMENIIENLPFGCRTVLRLSKVNHLSHKEISAHLGIAVSTVEKQHARALRLIREALDELRSDEAHEPKVSFASRR